MPSPAETFASSTLENTDKIATATENIFAATGADGFVIVVLAAVVGLIVLAVLAVLMPLFVFGIYRRANEINKHTGRLLNEIQSLNLALNRMAGPAVSKDVTDSSDPALSPATARLDKPSFIVDRDPGEPLPG